MFAVKIKLDDDAIEEVMFTVLEQLMAVSATFWNILITRTIFYFRIKKFVPR